MKDQSKYDKETMLARWLTGDITEDELNQLRETTDLEDLRQLTDAAQKLELPPLDKAAAWNQLKEKRSEKVPQIGRRRFLYPLSIAASLLFLLGLAWFVMDLGGSSSVEHTTAFGEQQSIDLPTGSQIQLHPASKLAYDASLWEKERLVQLEGAAYFEVSKGQKFVVGTGGGAVEVLGTQFDVYAFDGLLEVKCFEGKVRVTQGQKEIVLVAGEAVDFNKAGEGKRWEMAGDDLLPAWKSKKNRYESIELRRVLSDMERQFDQSFVVDETILKKVYTGGFPHDDLEKALRLVCGPMGLKFDIQQDQIVIQKK